MTPPALAFLTEEDRAALQQRVTLRDVADGDVVVAQADANRTLHWVRAGFVLVQRDVGGVKLSVARLGPGEFFGEMSLLEQAPVSADVVADGPVQLGEVHAADLDELSAQVPGFAERFYRSLAVVLSKRLRELGGFFAALDRRTAEQHQDLVDRLQPPEPAEHHELLARAQELRRRLADAEFNAALGGDEPAQIEAVFDEASSILKVRGPAGAAVLHRELYTTWMSSRTMAGSLLSVGGSPCANPTLERVYANEPRGEGAVGPVLDAWFLRRSALAGLRWAATNAAAQLGEGSLTLLGAVQGPVCDAALATDERLSVLDADEGALLDLHARAGGRKLLLAQISAQELARGRGRLALLPAETVVGIGLLDRTADEDLSRVLAVCRRLVTDSGTVWLSATVDDPDVGLFRHLLGWDCARRDRDSIVHAAESAGFAVEIHVHPAQLLFALRPDAS